VGSLCCCSGKQNCCGSPQPPHQNVEVSDPAKPDLTGLAGRASLVLLPRTPASTRPQGRKHPPSRWAANAFPRISLPIFRLMSGAYISATKSREAVALFQIPSLIGNYRDDGDLTAHPFHPSFMLQSGTHTLRFTHRPLHGHVCGCRQVVRRLRRCLLNPKNIRSRAILPEHESVGSASVSRLP
jgi:hypothetical protein